jgi:hypothetical protein
MLLYNYIMEFFESICWVVSGFLPTLVGLELAFRAKRFFLGLPRRQTIPTREKEIEVPI